MGVCILHLHLTSHNRGWRGKRALLSVIININNFLHFYELIHICIYFWDIAMNRTSLTASIHICLARRVTMKTKTSYSVYLIWHLRVANISCIKFVDAVHFQRCMKLILTGCFQCPTFHVSLCLTSL